MTYFPFCSLSPHSPGLTLLWRYFHGKCTNDFQSLSPPVKTFTARTRRATSTELKRPHFFRIPKSKQKFPLSFSQEPLLCGKDSHLDASLKTTFLATSRYGPAVIHPVPINNLSLSLVFISHTSFIDHYLEWLSSCVRWTLEKINKSSKFLTWPNIPTRRSLRTLRNTAWTQVRFHKKKATPLWPIAGHLDFKKPLANDQLEEMDVMKWCRDTFIQYVKCCFFSLPVFVDGNRCFIVGTSIFSWTASWTNIETNIGFRFSVKILCLHISMRVHLLDSLSSSHIS